QVEANGLGGVPLEQIDMVGSLARQGEHQALLLSAGRLHRVQVGDRLGRDEGRVVKIGERQVEVVERLYVSGQGWMERSRNLVLRKRSGGEVRDENETGMGAGAGDDPVGPGDVGDATLSG